MIKKIILGTMLMTSSLFAYEEVSVDFSVSGKDYTVKFTEAPKRAVTTSHFMTEILLSLGLEDSMAGTAFADNEILPELQTAYDKVPVLSKRYPSKEVFYSVNPDFISGWHSSLNPKRLSGVEELLENGINPYIISSMEKGATVEKVYDDYITIGKIFDVEDRAKVYVADLKEKVDRAGDIKGDKETVSVFAYDSGEESPFVIAGTGLGNDIIEKAGGKNIFEDIEGNYATVSWETVIIEDPDYILVVDYGNRDYESKIKFLKSNEYTRELKAVKADNIIVVTLAEMSPGPRVAGAIEKLAKGFYSN